MIKNLQTIEIGQGNQIISFPDQIVDSISATGLLLSIVNKNINVAFKI